MATSMDIVTLDNFASRMPPLDFNLSNHLYALVDMGRCAVSHVLSKRAALYYKKSLPPI